MAEEGYCRCKEKIRGAYCPCVQKNRDCQKFCACYPKIYEVEEEEEEEEEDEDNLLDLSFLNNADSIMFASQNAKVFGDYNKLDTYKLFENQVKSIVDLIVTKKIDFLVVQECTSEVGPREVVKILNSIEGNSYGYSCVNIGKGFSLVGKDFKGPEYAVVIYNINKLPQDLSSPLPNLITLSRKIMKSDPILVKCDFTNRYPAWFILGDLIVVTLHVTSNSSIQGLKTNGEINSLPFLCDYLKKENGEDKEIMFIGDFNLDPTNLAFSGLFQGKGYEALVNGGTRTNKGKVPSTFDNVLISKKFKRKNDILLQVAEQVNKSFDHHTLIMKVSPKKNNTSVFQLEGLPKLVLDSYSSKGIKIKFLILFCIIYLVSSNFP